MPKVKKTEDLDTNQGSETDDEIRAEDVISAQQAFEEEETLLTADRALPTLPIHTSFEELVTWLKKLKKVQVDHVKVYVYRKWPIINRKMADPDRPKYIDLLDGKAQDSATPDMMDKPYMITNHGGGRYEIWVVDTDKASKQKVTESKLDIPIADALPILNLDELETDHPKNQTYVNLLISQGKLKSDGSIVEDQNMSAPGAKGGNEVQFVTATLSKLVDRLLDERRREGQTITPGVEREALNKSLEMTTEAYKLALNNAVSKGNEGEVEKFERMLNVVKGMQPDTKGGDDKMFALFQTMLTMQSEHQKTMIELMRANTSGKSETEHFKGFLDVAMGMKDMFGGGGKSNALETVLQHGGPILGHVSQIVANVMMLRKGGQPVPVDRVPQAGQAGQRGAGALPAGNPEQEQQQQQQKGQTVHDVIRQYGGFILQHLNEGTKGDDFVDVLGDIMGRTAAFNLHASLSSVGQDGLLQVMEAIPEFWEQVKDKEKLKEFVDRFVRYHELGDVEEVPESGAGGVQ